MGSEAFASPQQAQQSQQAQDTEARQKIEKRRQQFRELQELRFNRRIERLEETQDEVLRERGGSSSMREKSASNMSRDDRPAVKLNRLSPEERVALRRQIREARQDIYLRRLQKK
jgi:flagellar motility protein MotE (MotC chaperone)